MFMKEDVFDGNSIFYLCRSFMEVVVGVKFFWCFGFVSGCLGLGCLFMEICGCWCFECEIDLGI